MVLDASAIVAILRQEAEADALIERLEGASDLLTHAISIFDASTAIARIKNCPIQEAFADVEDFLRKADIAVFALGPREASAALTAFAEYGKGQGHPAKLNMGDCFSYACAKSQGMRLLYKGADFAATDLT